MDTTGNNDFCERKLSFEGPNSYDEAGWVTEEILDNVGIHF